MSAASIMETNSSQLLLNGSILRDDIRAALRLFFTLPSRAYDTANNSCEVYEIKHSKERVPQQYRHINDHEKLAETERKYGRITKRAVLYRGDAYVEENGVEYINVEFYLNLL